MAEQKKQAAPAKKAEPLKVYRIHAPHYRLGKTYDKGSLVRVKESEKSKYWVECDEQGNPLEAPVEPVEVEPVEDDISVPESTGPAAVPDIATPDATPAPAPVAPSTKPDIFAQTKAAQEKQKRASDKDAI
jgi:hypothetical protein